jgi:RNA polymerase sigma-70 factor (ECF subfamily)
MVRRRRARTVTSDAASLDLMSGRVEEGSDEKDATSRIAMERAIEALSEPLRLVFLLREAEGYSHREIGALLGISSTASAIRLHRAWKELRKRLAIE